MTRPSRRRAALAVPGGLAAGAVAGTVATVAVIGGAPAPAAPKPPPVATAPVLRTTLRTSVLTEGALGYAAARPVLNQLSGTYTGLPGAGRRIAAGQVLYRVDDHPVVLMYGRVPAWRALQPGMPGGRDVRELQRNLIALGYARGLLSAPGEEFTWATEAAVERWQAATGQPVTGAIALGGVLFLPGPVRAGAPLVQEGDPATPGQAPYQVSTTTRVVTVPLNPVSSPSVSAGERVRIQLPDGTWMPGRVTAIGPPALAAAAGGSGQGGSGQGSPAGTATAAATVRPLHPRATGTGSGVPVQVALTTGSASDVLAVPVGALLALAGGGYAVEVAGPHGTHRLAAVRTGLFSGALVQISGTGIRPGLRVVTAQ